jgi:hypothetical protein
MGEARSSAEKTYLGFSRVVPGSTPSPVVSSALIALVAIGAGLRLMQYIGNPALSLDEIAVARNVLERNLWDLLATPLAYDQTAPKGFLIATKFVTSVFGSSDYALRLFPLLCSLAALIGFWRVAARILDGAGALVAVALFATALPVVSYRIRAPVVASALSRSRYDHASSGALGGCRWRGGGLVFPAGGFCAGGFECSAGVDPLASFSEFRGSEVDDAHANGGILGYRDRRRGCSWSGEHDALHARLYAAILGRRLHAVAAGQSSCDVLAVEAIDGVDRPRG